MEKKIHIYYINRIKDLTLKIFEYEDEDFEYVNRRAVANCEKAIQHWLDKANVKEELRSELLKEIDWCRNDCAEKLKQLGWQILEGKEKL